jgi:hypothetical protein
MISEERDPRPEGVLALQELSPNQPRFIDSYLRRTLDLVIPERLPDMQKSMTALDPEDRY